MTTLALYEIVTLGAGKRSGFSYQPVGLITIFVEFYPGHLVSLRIEHRVMCRALLSRG
jgi:hypothetical protein